MKSTIGTARSTNSLDARITEVEVVADEVAKVGGRQAIKNLPDGIPVLDLGMAISRDSRIKS